MSSRLVSSPFSDHQPLLEEANRPQKTPRIQAHRILRTENTPVNHLATCSPGHRAAKGHRERRPKDGSTPTQRTDHTGNLMVTMTYVIITYAESPFPERRQPRAATPAKKHRNQRFRGIWAARRRRIDLRCSC